MKALLSSGGRLILLKHVLSSKPIHLLAGIPAPRGVLDQLEKMLANFWWGGDEDKRKPHWISFYTMCLPIQVGAWGPPTTRHFQDLSKAFRMKLAWSIRGSQTLDCIFQKKVCPYGLLLPNLVVHALGVKSVLLSGNLTNT